MKRFMVDQNVDPCIPVPNSVARHPAVVLPLVKFVSLAAMGSACDMWSLFCSNWMRDSDVGCSADLIQAIANLVQDCLAHASALFNGVPTRTAETGVVCAGDFQKQHRMQILLRQNHDSQCMQLVESEEIVADFPLEFGTFFSALLYQVSLVACDVVGKDEYSLGSCSLICFNPAVADDIPSQAWHWDLDPTDLLQGHDSVTGWKEDLIVIVSLCNGFHLDMSLMNSGPDLLENDLIEKLQSTPGSKTKCDKVDLPFGYMLIFAASTVHRGPALSSRCHLSLEDKMQVRFHLFQVRFHLFLKHASSKTHQDQYNMTTVAEKVE